MRQHIFSPLKIEPFPWEAPIVVIFVAGFHSCFNKASEALSTLGGLDKETLEATWPLEGQVLPRDPWGKITWVVSKKDLNNRGYFFCKKGGWKTSQLGRDYDKPL